MKCKDINNFLFDDKNILVVIFLNGSKFINFAPLYSYTLRQGIWQGQFADGHGSYGYVVVIVSIFAPLLADSAGSAAGQVETVSALSLATDMAAAVGDSFSLAFTGPRATA